MKRLPLPIHIQHVQDSGYALLGAVCAPGISGYMVMVAVASGGPHGLCVQVKCHHDSDTLSGQYQGSTSFSDSPDGLLPALAYRAASSQW